MRGERDKPRGSRAKRRANDGRPPRSEAAAQGERIARSTGEERPASDAPPANASAAGSASATGEAPGRFSCLYESRDGGLCLFEDEFGHLTAVDASRLA